MMIGIPTTAHPKRWRIVIYRYRFDRDRNTIRGIGVVGPEATALIFNIKDLA